MNWQKHLKSGTVCGLLFTCGIMLFGCKTQQMKEWSETVTTFDQNKDGRTDKWIILRDFGETRLLKLVRLDHDSDGVPDVDFGKVYRDKQRVIAYSRDKKTGKTARSYYHGDRELMAEGDIDGDGWEETIIFFDKNNKPIEVFERTKCGQVIPAPKSRVQALEKTYQPYQQAQ